MVYRTGPGPTDGLIFLAGYVHTNPSVSNYANQAFAGALLKNFWHERPQDTIGFLFNYANISGALGNEQGLDRAFGLPVNSSFSGATQKHQEIIELNYNIHVTQGVSFQPLFQVLLPSERREQHQGRRDLRLQVEHQLLTTCCPAGPFVRPGSSLSRRGRARSGRSGTVWLGCYPRGGPGTACRAPRPGSHCRTRPGSAHAAGHPPSRHSRRSGPASVRAR